MCIYTEREEVDCWMREGMCISARSNTMRSACLRKFRKFSFITGCSDPGKPPEFIFDENVKVLSFLN